MRRRRRSSRGSRSAQKGTCALSSVYDYAYAGRRTWAPAGAPPRHRDPRAHLPRPARPAPGRRGPRGQPRAAGVHHRRRGRRTAGRGRQLPDRLRLRHRRDLGGEQHATPGRAGAAPGRPVHPHLLHGHAVRGVRGRVRETGRAHPRQPRQALRAVQLRRGGRGERGQDRPARHREAGGRGLRPRLPRPDQPHHGADREEHALQGQVRPVRRRDLPGADGLPAALARRPGPVRQGRPRRDHRA